MFLECLGEGAEYDAVLGEFLAEGGGDGHAVEYGVDGDAGESFLLFQGDAELFVGAEEFGVDLVEALELLLGLGGGVVDDVLVVDGGIVDVGPGGGLLFGLEFFPVSEGLETPFEHEFGLDFLGGDPADDVLV